MAQRPLAVVTGASTGIGYELAQCCAADGFDLVVVADEAQIEQAAARLREHGGNVTAVEANLDEIEGVEKLVAALAGRPVDALLANAGRGVGDAFLDQDFEKVKLVVDTNITGTLYLIHRIGRDMLRRNKGHDLDYRLHCRFYAWPLLRRLQWHQGFPEFLCAGVAQ
jgi:short-subunit dehydrogenase